MQAANPHELHAAFSPAPGSDPTAEQLEAVYATATGLCDEGNYRFAVALALHLTTYRPREPRFSFLAGTCMQQLGAHSNAARFFCFALIHGGDNPAVLYRLGECLLALGDKDNAEKALEAALDVAREVDGSHRVQSVSQDLIAAIRAGSAPGRPAT